MDLWEKFGASFRKENPMRPEMREEAAGKDAQASIFAEAEAIINGPRARDYGDAERSFKQIADLWWDYLGHQISPEDVAMMMVLLKMVRLKHSCFQHHDSFVDMLGYVGLAHKVAGQNERTT